MTDERARLEAERNKLHQAIAAQEALQGILPEEQLATTLATLRQKLASVEITLGGTGNILTGEGNLGAVATDHSTAIAQVQGNVYLNQPPPDPAQARRQEARQRYLTALRRHCQVMSLAAFGGEEGADEDLTLDRIYIELDTTQRVPLSEAEKTKRQGKRSASLEREQEERAVTALEAASQATRLALLGDPGAGKSTFVRKLVGWQAAAMLGETTPLPGIPATLLPILLTLRDLAPRLEAVELATLSEEQQRQTLAALVRHQFLANLAHLEVPAELAEELRAALTGGDCLLVLDGLDEVPQALRQRVRQAVAAVLGLYGAKRIIVTCRVRSYVGEAILPHFQAYTLAPFDEEKIRNFAQAWYQAQRELGRFDATQAKQKAANLAEAALAEALRELAENPMLLTTMALIHQKEIGLPRERVRLYSLAVEVLLHRWQKRKTGETGLNPSAALAAVLQNNLRLRQVVERLAYEAHRAGRGQKQTADLPRGEALLLLEHADYLGQAALADEFLDYADQRAGLLVGRGGELKRPTTYSFPHRTFQEYLAGCHLIRQRNTGRVFYEHAREGDTWALAAQLGAEELLYNSQQPKDLLDLAYRLCPTEEPTTEQSRRAILWSGQMAVLLGGEAIERDTGGPEEGPVYLRRLLPRLVKLLASELSAPERAEAGRVLAKLGDPRPGVGLRQGGLLPGQAAATGGLPDILWCEVPAGPFLMGDKKKEVKLPAFRISGYPITNAQYAAFVSAKGYLTELYWPETKQAGYWSESGFKGRYDDAARDRPVDYGSPYNLDNHPVVGVSWYEAVAFCHWLTQRLQAVGELGLNQEVSLPTEAYWEKAARGTDGRIYPWGDEADPDRANYDETGLGTTSAVGCFPGGTSPYGCLDMSGNVWEWCRTKYGQPDDDSLEGDVNRVMRGGAFNANENIVRCAFRFHVSPDYWNFNIGFRVMVSPFS